MSDVQETIAAISTAWGEGGVGIIRLSGPLAIEAALGVFHPASKAPLKERYLHSGLVKDPSGAALDSALMVFMKGPRSATGEDVVELHCHGGPLLLKRVLGEVLACGARLALPGEFTKRAFLNGKLDLSQAEAVIDIIRAQTETALSSASGRLQGTLGRRVKQVKDGLFDLLVHLEAELDFPEDEIDGLPREGVLEALSGAGVVVKRLLLTFDEGRVIRDGIRALILGRPNAGKSSLLNILLMEERAIVTHVPGTTRDVIEEVVNIRGLPVRLMDTAGLRETGDFVEKMGVLAARSRIKDAGIVLYVIDASADDLGEDLANLEGLRDKKVIVAVNKTDIAGAREIPALCRFNAVHISALTGEGIEALKDEIYAGAVGHPYMSTPLTAPSGELIVSLRHKQALERALDGIERASKALDIGLPRELVATDLRSSIEGLGEITGETTTEDILDKIFENFCIGK
ncbi:MAG: tRNA uridine-5-carboxymethylaminomethyl(34) synthesis GTPase MnmE [Deltaproteobacteria bacterium GWB2_55_19]|nr:MAG: tRNA uridine-5-carboxymethylaminomethyl(34) synthesis GTPase MnmE [Deltaproteobacteria bacterium GWB2_55_19]HAO92311.1 tRNA uridine-5-carboxymethylaminomethyl(34) synthesis GTPase MnmE [Deltaproteobacteria bacterium]